MSACRAGGRADARGAARGAGSVNAAIDGAAAALFAAGIAARTKGKILWCITRQDLFAPALAQVGLAADRVIYVDACDEKSVLACFEEGVRHGGLGAVVAEVARILMTSSRRFSLAAEASGSIAKHVDDRGAVRCHHGDFHVERGGRDRGSRCVSRLDLAASMARQRLCRDASYRSPAFR